MSSPRRSVMGRGSRLTARMDPAVRRAITAIPETGWTPIHYPNAVWDEDEQRLISDAEVAEIEFTAFTSRPQRQQVTARLIVRRVKRLNPAGVRGRSGRPVRGLPAPRGVHR